MRAKETSPNSVRRRSGGGSTVDDTDEGLEVTSEGQSWPEIVGSTKSKIEEAQAGLVDLARELAVVALNAKEYGDRTSQLITHVQAAEDALFLSTTTLDGMANVLTRLVRRNDLLSTKARQLEKSLAGSQTQERTLGERVQHLENNWNRIKKWAPTAAQIGHQGRRNEEARRNLLACKALVAKAMGMREMQTSAHNPRVLHETQQECARLRARVRDLEAGLANSKAVLSAQKRLATITMS